MKADICTDLSTQPVQAKHLSFIQVSLVTFTNIGLQVPSMSMSDSDPDGNHNESDVSDSQLSEDALKQQHDPNKAKAPVDEMKYLGSAPETLDSGTRRGKVISNDRLSLPPEVLDSALEPDYATLPQLRYASLSPVFYSIGLTLQQ